MGCGWQRAAAIGLTSSFAWVSGACSLAFELDREQCETSADCEAAGFADATCVDKVCAPSAVEGGGGSGGGEPVDPRWSCLAAFEPPLVEGPIRYSYRFELATAPPGTPPADLTVKLCTAIDVACANPVAGFPAPDADGSVSFEVDANFKGFIEASSPAILPTIAFLETPVILPPTQKIIRVIGQTDFMNLVSIAGETWDPTRGTAVVLTNDCADERSAGVSIEQTNTVDPGTVPFYFKGSLPVTTATETDAQGAAGFLNLPVGVVNVETRRASTGERIGSTSFQSRAGTISYAPLGPTL